MLSQEPIAERLLHKTLLSELQEFIVRNGPWFDEPVFIQAVDTLLPIVTAIHTPLAFSSGDYNQGNFLFDGHKLTGFIDFTGACFEDPHVGMAMYWIYSWYPLDKSGIVERYLEEHQLSFADFAPRLAVRCLSTLQQQIAVVGGEDVLVEDEYESHVDAADGYCAAIDKAADKVVCTNTARKGCFKDADYPTDDLINRRVVGGGEE